MFDDMMSIDERKYNACYVDFFETSYNFIKNIGQREAKAGRRRYTNGGTPSLHKEYTMSIVTAVSRGDIHRTSFDPNRQIPL